MIQPAQSQPALSQSEKIAWLRLIRTNNIGPVTFYNLMEMCGSAEAALERLPELSKRGGRKESLKAAEPKWIEKEGKALAKMGGRFITAACPDYPLVLGAIPDAPPVIAVLGNPRLLNESCIGIVGARNASLNGRKFAEKLARDLGADGQIIVSGLARGIDTAAHTGSLDSGTVAVVAGGIDVVYPEENKGLYEQIKERGCIVAESPLGTAPKAQHFPRRNRIVSGLSQGVAVVEATLKSGSLITARLAGEQGRDVYAVPGHPLDPRASGPNQLIKDGATLVRSAADILETLNSFTGGGMQDNSPAPYQPPPPANLEPSEQARQSVLDNLSFTPVGVDELIRTCHVSIPEMQMILLELELAGRIKRLPGNRVSLLH